MLAMDLDVGRLHPDRWEGREVDVGAAAARQELLPLSLVAPSSS